MKRTRPQLLWRFQEYLDARAIMEPERRERLSAMFLERQLSRPTELDFSAWMKGGAYFREQPQLMRTRGSRLMFFRAWLDTWRPMADREERERLTRLYNARQLSRDIEREFHQFVRTSGDNRRMP